MPERLRATRDSAGTVDQPPQKVIKPSPLGILLLLALIVSAFGGYRMLLPIDSPALPAPAIPAPPKTRDQAGEMVETGQRETGKKTPSAGASGAVAVPGRGPTTGGQRTPAPAVDDPLELGSINVTGYIYNEDNPRSSRLFVDGIVYSAADLEHKGIQVKVFGEGIVVLAQGDGERAIRIR
jgi:hypothetical protein